MWLSLFLREATTSSLAYYKQKLYLNKVFLDSPGLEAGGVLFAMSILFVSLKREVVTGCGKGVGLGMMDVDVGVADDIPLC